MKKPLVAYFSATGTTAAAAEKLAQAEGADLYEIRPAVPYSAADLDWTNRQSRSSLEMTQAGSRPALADTDAAIENYDTIFLGFPIWWYRAPAIIQTFLESYDFGGKKIVLFATSGGSDLGKTAQILKASLPQTAEIVNGRMMNRIPGSGELRQWADSELA